VIDRIADKKIIHKNKAARHKSRLSAQIKGLAPSSAVTASRQRRAAPAGAAFASHARHDGQRKLSPKVAVCRLGQCSTDSLVRRASGWARVADRDQRAIDDTRYNRPVGRQY
jgi:hypothetical protein